MNLFKPPKPYCEFKIYIDKDGSMIDFIHHGKIISRSYSGKSNGDPDFWNLRKRDTSYILSMLIDNFVTEFWGYDYIGDIPLDTNVKKEIYAHSRPDVAPGKNKKENI